MPNGTFPPTPVVFVQTSMNGVIAAGGSSNKKCSFVFNWRRAATVLAVNKTIVEAAFQASICVPIVAALNARYTQTDNAIRWANDALNQPTKFSRALVGAIAGDSMPTYASAYLLMSAGLRGGMFKGSKHLGPMSESDTTTGTDDTWNAGCLARLATIAAAILAGFVDATGNAWIPVVIGGIGSDPQTTFQNATPNIITYSDVITVTVQRRAGTMVRRKVKPV